MTMCLRQAIFGTRVLRKSESLRQSALMNVLKAAVNFDTIFVGDGVKVYRNILKKKTLVTRRYFRLQMH